MESSTKNAAVLFDLDNTLFDHFHSVRSAIQAVRTDYPSLAERQDAGLIAIYNRCLQQAYDQYLRKEISYEEKDVHKIRLFFAELGLPEPNAEEVQRFRAKYDAAYMASRRATPGSVETLVRLKEHGYRLAIVSNGQIEDQRIKAEAIGVRVLVECLCTSEEAGKAKPDPQLFAIALDALGVSAGDSYMVGDSPESDVQGALNVGLHPILFDPQSKEKERLLFGQQVPVIRKMHELLDLLGIQLRTFQLDVNDVGKETVIRGLGIDIISAPRHCLHISQETIERNARRMGIICALISKGEYLPAMKHLQGMIETISVAATLIDEKNIRIQYPGKDDPMLPASENECQMTHREFSVHAQYPELRLSRKIEDAPLLRTVVTLLQEHCNNLMRDHPRASLRNLRSAMLAIANAAGIALETEISGEKIDEQ